MLYFQHVGITLWDNFFGFCKLGKPLLLYSCYILLQKGPTGLCFGQTESYAFVQSIARPEYRHALDIHTHRRDILSTNFVTTALLWFQRLSFCFCYVQLQERNYFEISGSLNPTEFSKLFSNVDSNKFRCESKTVNLNEFLPIFNEPFLFEAGFICLLFRGIFPSLSTRTIPTRPSLFALNRI